ncbi:MAG: ABC transporter substrate-binding protein [Eubacterium sp.]|nr:ABC transporter substrate-binding protein [Eubacterium sp.]
MKKEYLKTGYSIVFILAFALLLLVVFIFGNHKVNDTSEEEEVTELTIVYAYQNSMWSSFIEKAATEFEAEHPEIDITFQTAYGDTVYETILNKMIARDELGDIVQVKAPEAYVQCGIFGEIPDSVTQLVSEENRYTYKDKTYAVGIVNTTTGIMYNKALFEKYHLQEPTTYDEFLECCAVLKKHHITPLGIGGSDLWHMEFWVNHFLRTNVLSENEDWFCDCSKGTVSWTDEEITQSLTQLKDLFDAGYVNSDWLSTTDGSLPYLLSEGDTAMVMTGPWVEAEVTELNDQAQWGWFYLPDEDGQVVVGENRDTYFAVSADCQADEKKYQAAEAFLNYFYSSDNYSNLLQSITSFSTTKESVEYEKNDFQEEVTEAFTDYETHITGYVGDSDTPEGFETEMLQLIQQMLQDKISIEKTQKKLQKCWEKYEESEVDASEEN